MANVTGARGNATEAAVLADLLRLGYNALIPWGGNARYDLAVDLDGRLVRIQCKTAWSEDENTIVFKARSNSGWRGLEQRGYIGDAEVFGVFHADRNLVLYVPVEDVPVSYIKLRDERTDRRHRRLIGDYLKPPF